MSDGVRFVVADISMHMNDYMVEHFPYQFYYPGGDPLTRAQKKEVNHWLILNFGEYTSNYERWNFLMDRVYLTNQQDAFMFKIRWV